MVQADKLLGSGLRKVTRATKDSNLDFIYRLGDATRDLTEPEDIMSAVAAAVGSHLAVSRCIYADVEADNNCFTIHRDYTDNCASIAGTYELESFGDQAAGFMRSGETFVIHDVDADLGGEQGAEAFIAMGIKAVIGCSLVRDGRLVAMMGVHQIEPRKWCDDEIALVREIVERCWSTIERAKSQKLAHRNEQKFKAFFEYAPDAQILVDEDGSIQLVNERFVNMFGAVAADVVGKQVAQWLPAEVDENNFIPSNSVAENSTRLLQAMPLIRIQNRAGRELYVEITQNSILTDEGKLRALSIRDVSERVRLENELQQAKKIETLGMLAGGIAHDFNNLLTVIIGAAELPLHKDKGDFRFRKELETIRNVGARAGELTQQLLAFSRQQVLQPEILDLNAVLKRCQDIIKRLIGENIAVSFDLDSTLLSVNLDKTQMEQVLMNLAANARDAMPDGGKLTVTTSVVAQLPDSLVADSASRQTFVRLTVSDTGSGMSEEQVAKIFDPFYTTKAEGKGTGLGLSTVYGIITQSDGHITVRSERDNGTCFEMYFPSVDALPVSEIENNKKEDNMISERILIVEDEPALCDVLYELLLACGYTVEAAAHGHEALEIFRNKPESFGLIITDVIMPGMNGPQFIEQAREIRPDVKVIFSSGYTADTIGHHGVLESDQNFLGKPYSFETLESTVRAVLKK